ncbi:CoA transferase subunit A [Jannaschia rubra]|uniref:Putative succinyl-CoA:3-ketoacid coenzyme A transferase subunit A n=1 Tax=Jannaschia rubra TaxID=282197 RepID=A0A0M6XU97_9RHOB|nr:CoA transferase subunit A [Jannaschia rubra]CTQ33853.1 putative succinyl-CoA:3-ketoacid coenzyme A transferase subunit A [Jannaschia rubra]SFG10881.1 3-oxoacid CoA-transferase subunit A [Jannaschia rubra]
MKKVYSSAAEALDGLLHDGMFIAAGGFGLCGIPELLLEAIKEAGTKDLTFASNNAGVDDFGIGILLQTKQVKKMISSYVGENAEFMRQYLSGELELEFNPQGTLAERMRAGGCGIPGFYTKTGVGTVIAEGKEHKDFPTGPDGEPETYIMERGIVADLAVVKAWKGDATGNLVFRKTARNFNPPAAMCGRVCVAEVEEIVETGTLDPDGIHLPGIYVHRIIQGEHEKRIEQRTVRAKKEAM